MRYLRWIFGVMMCASLQSCAPARVAPVGNVSIAPNIQMSLPRPGDMRRSLEATQLVRIQHKEMNVMFEGHISITPQRVLIVALDGMGRKALTIDWTTEGISYEAAPFVPRELHPENILADIVLLYWPVDSLHFSDPAAKLVTAKNRRTLMQGNTKILDAIYTPAKKDVWTGNLHYDHLIWDYSMDIQSLENAP